MFKGFSQKIMLLALCAGVSNNVMVGDGGSAVPGTASNGQELVQNARAITDGARRELSLFLLASTVSIAGALMVKGAIEAGCFLWDKLYHGKSWTKHEIGTLGVCLVGGYCMYPYILAYALMVAKNIKIEDGCV